MKTYSQLAYAMFGISTVLGSNEGLDAFSYFVGKQIQNRKE